MPLDQHPAVAAQARGVLPAAFHRVDRQRIGLPDHRYRGDDRDAGVAAAEDEVVPVVDGEAVSGVGLAAFGLGEPAAE